MFIHNISLAVARQIILMPTVRQHVMVFTSVHQHAPGCTMHKIVLYYISIVQVFQVERSVFATVHTDLGSIVQITIPGTSVIHYNIIWNKLKGIIMSQVKPPTMSLICRQFFLISVLHKLAIFKKE